MAKKYKECMNFMVYEVFDVGVEAEIADKTMYKLKAQFDEKDDADLFINIKSKQGGRKYELFKNDEYSVFGNFA